MVLECETNPVSRGEEARRFWKILGREEVRGSDRSNNPDAHDFCMRMR
jgi:hypothetical protein